MRSIFLVIWTSLILLIGQPLSIQAHDVAASGPVKSTIHIDPADSPVVGQPATIQILLERNGRQLDLGKCSCSLTIIQNKTDLVTVPLVAPTIPAVWSASVPFAFPRKDTYTLVVTGKPNNDSDAFTPFTLKTVFRVVRLSPNQPASPHDPDSWTHYLHFLLPAVAGGYLLVALFRQWSNRETPR